MIWVNGRKGRQKQVNETTRYGKRGGKEDLQGKERTGLTLGPERAAITEGVHNYPILKMVLCCCYCHHHCSVLAAAFSSLV
jgi:hypothetical protein